MDIVDEEVVVDGLTESSRVDPEEFRSVVGHFMTGVTVVTTRDQDRDHGVTASAVSSLSLTPPTMVVCLNLKSRTGRAVQRSGAFAINVLSEGQGALAERFASSGDDKFAGLEFGRGELGSPLLGDALAHIDCVVAEQVPGGTHALFLGEVLSAKASSGSPLAYFRGAFGRFQFGRDDEVYQELRSLILDRRYGPDEPLTVIGLAGELGVDSSPVFYALTRLTADALVTRDPERGYVVVPIDEEASNETFDARCAIELGVVELAIDTISEAQIAELRARLAAMVPLIQDDRFVDLEQYLAANDEYHRCLVSLAGNTALTEAYRRLSVKGLLARALRNTDRTSNAVIEDHVNLTAALERRDRQAARESLLAHSERVKARAAAALSAAGGTI